VQGGVFPEEVSQRIRKRKRDILLGTWNKMDLQEVGGCRGDGMELAQDRDEWRALVSMVKNLLGSIKCGEFLH
jgi:hypothetical protein